MRSRGSRPGVGARRGAPQLWPPKGRGTRVRPERRGGGEGALPSGLLRGGPSPLVTILTFLLPRGRCRGPGPERRPGPGAELRTMSSRSPRPPPRRCRRRLPRPSCCCCCCRRSHLNEDTGRFVLLAALIGLYLVAGATVFSALESPGEAEARARWGATLRNFSAAHGVAEPELRAFLRHYEAALAAGVRADALRPRWDFPGAFYFVGTVVSTIGELRARRATFLSASFTCCPFHCSGARAASLGFLFPSNARVLTFIAPSPPRQSLSSCFLSLFTGFRRGRWPERPITGAYPAVTARPRGQTGRTLTRVLGRPGAARAPALANSVP